MKNKILKSARYLAITITVLASISCDDWLNLEPENDLIRQEFWKSKADVDAVLAATYDALRETSMETMLWGEIRADLIGVSGTDFADYGRISASNITASNGAVRWNEYYSAINLANTLMEYSGDVVGLDPDFTEKMKKNYDSEALFIRSLAYFYLVRLWKQVPLVLEASTTDTVKFYVPKSTEREVLNQLVNDLKYAETIAWTKSEIGNNNEIFRGRVNKYSIQTLLADIYLWMEDYENCLEYCNRVIGSQLYWLLPEQNWFNLYYPGNSNESIFEIQYNDGIDSEDNPIYDKLIPLNGTRFIYITSNYVELLGSDVDVRAMGVRMPYYKYHGKVFPGNQIRELTERDANFIYYRYADIVLMKAECLAELSQFQEAGQLLNQVVTRAGNSPMQLSNSISDFRNAILTERAKEFTLEGKRWFDVLRFAKKNNFSNKHLVTQMLLSGVTSIKDFPKIQARVNDTMFYYLPIPEHDILNNPALEQNPFYNR